MNVYIEETGEQKTLTAIDPKTGVDNIEDLLGNADVFALPVDNGGIVSIDDDDGPTGIYRCNQSTYEWWVEYIDGMEKTADDIEQLCNDLIDAGLDGNEVDRIMQREYWSKIGGGDEMEYERRDAVELIKAIREAYL